MVSWYEGVWSGMNEVRGQIFRGAVWVASSKLIERGIGLVSTLILVRVLLPEDFGLVAMAMSVMVAIEVFTSFGFDVVLIQNRDAEPAHYHTVWTFNVGIGVLFAASIALAAGAIATFYRDERLVHVLYAIAAIHAVGSLENIRIVDFRKYMQFHRDVAYRLAVKVAGFVVAVPTAIATQSYWALVAGMAAISVAKLVFSFWMKPFMPRPTLSRAREIFSFSVWLMANNAMFTAISRAQDFIIGRLLGARALGLFNVSNEISNMITTEIVAPINRAAFPGYARLSSDVDELRRTYLDVMGCIMLVAVPAAVGIAAVAELLVPLLLGANWLDAVPVVKVLALFGAVYSLSTNSVYVFHALAQPRRVTALAAWQLAATLPALYFGTVWYGLPGAAWALLLVGSVVAVPLMWVAVAGALRMSVMRVVERFLRPLLACGLMYVVVREFVDVAVADAWQVVLALIGAVGLGVLVYLAAISALWRLAGRPGGGELIIWTQATALSGWLSVRVSALLARFVR